MEGPFSQWGIVDNDNVDKSVSYSLQLLTSHSHIYTKKCW